jgi:hypothetical protein
MVVEMVEMEEMKKLYEIHAYFVKGREARKEPLSGD